MRGRLRRRRNVLLAAAGIIAAAAALGSYAARLLRQAELGTIDTRFSVRGSHKPPRDLVVVEIDDATFSDLQQQFPFPRRLHAGVIDRLRRDGARVIGFDVQFTERQNNVDDQALADAVARAGNVVLSTTEVAANGQTNILGGNLAQLRALPGNTSVKLDNDGAYRRFQYELDGLKSFPVVVAQRATGHAPPRADFRSGSALIDYAGSPGTISHISFSRVLRGQFKAGLFRGKIVVVGASAPSLQDNHPTSASRGEEMPGPEIQANAISTALRGLPLRESGPPVDVLLIVLMAAAVPLGSLRLRGLAPLLLALGAVLLYVLTAQLAFDAGRVIPVLYPLLGLGLATLGTVAVNYLVEEFERERVRDLFARFVPEQVVDAVLERTDENMRLGGIERVCTVMFCDLRGFTTFSESLPAERVIEVVNFYLGQMSEAILGAGGTLLAYLGDGIMALFGAPLKQEDHADRALTAAREMVGPRLAAVNAWLESEGLPGQFRMGVGLNTGEVMAGNVGSERRLEYTAIGDTTNTASRLEGLTKGTPHMVFLADSTRAALLRPADDLVAAGEFDVRGRKAKLAVWGVPEPVD